MSFYMITTQTDHIKNTVSVAAPENFLWASRGQMTIWGGKNAKNGWFFNFFLLTWGGASGTKPSTQKMPPHAPLGAPTARCNRFIVAYLDMFVCFLLKKFYVNSTTINLLLMNLLTVLSVIYEATTSASSAQVVMESDCGTQLRHLEGNEAVREVSPPKLKGEWVSTR